MTEVKTINYTQEVEEEDIFVGDSWVAQRIGMKPATIRTQRFKRLHRQEHWFRVDPVYIGSKPRYRIAEVVKWMNECSPAQC